MTQKTKSIPNFGRLLPWVLLVSGGIAFLAAFTLTIEQFQTFKDPSHIPSCNINPIISCGSVMTTTQAEAFGFSNSLIGIAVYAVVAAIGLALLAGAKFKKWFWLALQLLVSGALAFVLWLAFESLYRLGTICPYCFVVWISTIPVFWYTTLYNIQAKNIPTPKKLSSVKNFTLLHHGDLLVLGYAVLLGLILHRFWYYWSTLI